MKVAAIVPSLNPDKKFTQVIEDLVAAGFTRIYVVNDGSSREYDPYFEAAAAHPECTLLRHSENRGKGRALKTAFERYLTEADGFAGVVTLDGDGQHHIEDVLNVAAQLRETPDTLVLGARDFSQSHVPAKNALGNILTRKMFSMLCGIPITDTQTGLRGIPNAFIGKLLNVNGERYEFETNMLLETRRMGVPVKEIPISTIYIDNNSASHFRPLVDGMRIYLLIFKFAFSSFASFLVDFILFAILDYLLAFLAPAHRLLAATVGARVGSALFNFTLNRRLVFASSSGLGSSFVKYTLLSVVQMFCSYGGVFLLSEVLPLPTLLAKILVDFTLFFVSFFVQRRWVFRSA